MQVFLSDSEEELARMEEAVLALEERPEDRPTIEAIFRTVHTLKGNASILDLQAFSQLAHVLEDVLHAVRSRKATVTLDLTTLLLRGVDALREKITALRAGRQDDGTGQRELLADLAACLVETTEPGQDETAVDVDPDRVDADPAPEPDARWSPVLRVEIAKLDQLLGLTARASVVQGQISAALAGAPDTPAELWDLHRKHERLLMELQDWVMDARMVPISGFFRSHARTVRDTARTQRKRARIRIEGEDVRVDTRVGDSVRDALTHLVRNALDHGIELPSVRAAAGKPPEGTVVLRAFHNANQVVIQVSDDGAGFSLAKIRARARALGRSNVDTLPAEALYRIAFEPGFSTSESVTELSGRGVGMDVVLRKVEALHGTVDIESREGAGTTIELRLPLTISVIEGFWVEIAGADYVLPLDQILECLELPLTAHHGRERDGIVELRGEPLAYHRLRHLLGVEGAPPPREHLVVVRHDRGRVGIAVDAITGQRQTVIKPMGRLFRGVVGISGSTLRSDGRVALVIDIARLLRAARRPSTHGRTIGTTEPMELG